MQKRKQFQMAQTKNVSKVLFEANERKRKNGYLSNGSDSNEFSCV